MNTEHPERRYELSEPIVLHFYKSKIHLPIKVIRMDQVAAYYLFGHLSIDHFTSALANKAFHFDEQEAVPNWEPDLPLDIILRLDAAIAHNYADPDDLFSALLQPESTLLDADHWYAIEVMQRVPLPWDNTQTTSFGFQTRWANN